jgi:hypothetical protein
MVTKTMRQSSGNAMDIDRQFGHSTSSYDLSPSKYATVATTNRELTWWEKFKDWVKKLTGR